MPIYVYRCNDCATDYELWMDPGPPEKLDGAEDCSVTGKHCALTRRWVAPAIGFVDGAGFSPPRGTPT